MSDEQQTPTTWPSYCHWHDITYTATADKDTCPHCDEFLRENERQWRERLLEHNLINNFTPKQLH